MCPVVHWIFSEVARPKRRGSVTKGLLSRGSVGGSFLKLFLKLKALTWGGADLKGPESSGASAGFGGIMGSSAASTGASIFGSSTSSSPGNLFGIGASSSASVFGAKETGESLFGSGSASTGDLKSSDKEPKKQSTGSIFGSGSGSSATNLFGSSTPAAPLSTSSLFGSGSASAASSGTFKGFGDSAKESAGGSIFGSGPLSFGTSQSSSVGLFGTSPVGNEPPKDKQSGEGSLSFLSTKPDGNLFGNSSGSSSGSSSAPAGNLFGASSSTSIFGTKETGASLFGSGSASSGGLKTSDSSSGIFAFGSNKEPEKQSTGSIFGSGSGSSATNLFGSSTPAAPLSTSSLFGSGSASAASSGTFKGFGDSAKESAGGSIFGSGPLSFGTSQSSSVGLFGTSPVGNEPPKDKQSGEGSLSFLSTKPDGNLFGNSSGSSSGSSSAPAGNLFGASSSTSIFGTKETGASLFGSGSASSGGLKTSDSSSGIFAFGSNKEPEKQSTGSIFGSGSGSSATNLFGSKVEDKGSCLDAGNSCFESQPGLRSVILLYRTLLPNMLLGDNAPPRYINNNIKDLLAERNLEQCACVPCSGQVSKKQDPLNDSRVSCTCLKTSLAIDSNTFKCFSRMGMAQTYPKTPGKKKEKWR